MTFGGAEARSRRRQGGTGGPGSPRPVLTPSNIPSSPPPSQILTFALASAQIKGAPAFCATEVVKERYLIPTGAAGHPISAVWALWRRKICVLLLACVWLLARGQISKSSMWSKRGKPPRLCRPYDSTRAGEALGAGAGVARASADRQTRRKVSAGSASYIFELRSLRDWLSEVDR